MSDLGAPPSALRAADALLARGRFDEAERCLDEAFRGATDDAARAEVEDLRARLARQRGDASGVIAHSEQALRLLGRHVPGSGLGCAMIVMWELFVQLLHAGLPKLFVGRRAREGADRELLAIRAYRELAAPYGDRRGVIWSVWAQLRARNLDDCFPPELAGREDRGPQAAEREDRGPAAVRGSGRQPVVPSAPGDAAAAAMSGDAPSALAVNASVVSAASAAVTAAARASAAAQAAANGAPPVQLDDAVRQLKATQEQLLHAGRMAAVGTLIAGLAHELNNPLTVIIGNVEHLRSLTGDDDQVVRAINAIDRQAKRAARLVNTLLRFSRTGGASREEVAPHELIRLVVDLVAAEARRREIELRVTVAEGLGPLFAARHEIESALVNLATNALQATPEGGVVELSASAERRQAIPGIRFVVRDTGVGIAPEILPQIFDPFFTTKPEGEGTGLGLSLSREIATAHGGELAVISKPGQGTTMSLWLPEGGSGSRSRRTPVK